MAKGTRHSTKTLSGLPAELLVEIFEASDSFPSALALSRTCHRLHSIWTSNADTILPSIVECFPQAQKLATTQENAAREQTHTQPTSLIRPTKLPITINQRISQNANLASLMLQTFETTVISSTPRQATDPITRPSTALTPTERASFHHGFYLALTYILHGRYFPFLFPLPFLSYLQMSEAMDVLSHHLTTSPTSPLHRIRSPETDMTVSETVLDFRHFHTEFKNWAGCRFATVPTWPDEEDRWENAPLGYFIRDDGYRAKKVGVGGEQRGQEGPLLEPVLKEIAKIIVALGGEVP